MNKCTQPRGGCFSTQFNEVLREGIAPRATSFPCTSPFQGDTSLLSLPASPSEDRMETRPKSAGGQVGAGTVKLTLGK